MILVKKRYLFTLTILFCLLVVFGEIKFFMALQSVNTHANLELKYEMENFIFATILVLLVVFLFFIGFIRSSENILKRLDKMIQLSEYGKHDVSAHMEKMGTLGRKFNYLTHHLNNLNDMRTLKISSLSGIVDFLVGRSDEALFLTDAQGNILDCSRKFEKELMKDDKKNMIGKNMNEFLVDEDFRSLLSELKDERFGLEKDKVSVFADGKEKKKRAFFKPIKNSKGQISNVIGVLAGEEHFKGLFGKRGG